MAEIAFSPETSAENLAKISAALRDPYSWPPGFEWDGNALKLAAGVIVTDHDLDGAARQLYCHSATHRGRGQ